MEFAEIFKDGETGKRETMKRTLTNLKEDSLAKNLNILKEI